MTILHRRGLLSLAAAVAITPPAWAQQTKLRVGSTPTGTPFTFLDTKTNTITGFMVDVIDAIGRKEGFGVDVQATPFAALIPSLTTSRIDLISAAMLATPARREQIDFSDPVYGYGEGLAVKDGETPGWTTMDDLKGLSTGAQIGTIYLDALKKAGAEVRTYDTAGDMVRDLTLGRIKAAVFDAPIMAYNVAEGNFRGIRMVTDYRPSVVGQICLGVRKGDPVLTKLNAGLAALRADGLAGLIAKWRLPPSVPA